MFSWQTEQKPILALSPMDGITDVAYRQIHALYGKPSIMFTEFTNVEGMFMSDHTKLFTDLMYLPEQRPIIAQIFGSTPEYFYKAAIVCCELGFDGIDINMGCPAKNVAHLGGGAALIGKPELAKEIIRSVQKGVSDWTNGKLITDVALSEEKLKKIEEMKKQAQHIPPAHRSAIPVSVKTRIGVNEITIEEWVKHLLETEPANISIHGRTLKQMYTGLADWEAIGKAAQIIRQSNTTVMGNGDILSKNDALMRIEKYKLDGVLIGRASMGNPFIWDKDDKEYSPEQRLQIALEHAKLHKDTKAENLFIQMRKHFSFYISNFPHAHEIKVSLLKANSYLESEEIITTALNEKPWIQS